MAIMYLYIKVIAALRKLHTHTNVLVSILLSFQLIIAPAVGKIGDRIRIYFSNNIFVFLRNFAALASPGYIIGSGNEKFTSLSSLIWRTGFLFDCIVEVGLSGFVTLLLCSGVRV